MLIEIILIAKLKMCINLIGRENSKKHVKQFVKIL